VISPASSTSYFVLPGETSGHPSYLTEGLKCIAEKRPERPCVYQGRVTTVEKVWERVLRASTWLQRNGVEAGNIVLIALSVDHPDAQTIALAVTHAGATVSFLPPDMTLERFQRIMERSSPACVFLDGGNADLGDCIDSVITVWMTPGCSQGGWNEAELEEIFAERPAWGMPFPGKPDDGAFLVYDNSDCDEGEVWSHRSLINMMASRNSGSRILQSLPGLTQEDVHKDLLQF
jgi:acyl-CoA synthetase (AMP-forming)/AMP-acid ligase II